MNFNCKVCPICNKIVSIYNYLQHLKSHASEPDINKRVDNAINNTSCIGSSTLLDSSLHVWAS